MPFQKVCEFNCIRINDDPRPDVVWLALAGTTETVVSHTDALYGWQLPNSPNYDVVIWYSKPEDTEAAADAIVCPDPDQIPFPCCQTQDGLAIGGECQNPHTELGPPFTKFYDAYQTHGNLLPDLKLKFPCLSLGGLESIFEDVNLLISRVTEVRALFSEAAIDPLDLEGIRASELSGSPCFSDVYLDKILDKFVEITGTGRTPQPILTSFPERLVPIDSESVLQGRPEGFPACDNFGFFTDVPDLCVGFPGQECLEAYLLRETHGLGRCMLYGECGNNVLLRTKKNVCPPIIANRCCDSFDGLDNTAGDPPVGIDQFLACASITETAIAEYNANYPFLTDGCTEEISSVTVTITGHSALAGVYAVPWRSRSIASGDANFFGDMVDCPGDVRVFCPCADQTEISANPDECCGDCGDFEFDTYLFHLKNPVTGSLLLSVEFSIFGLRVGFDDLGIILIPDCSSTPLDGINCDICSGPGFQGEVTSDDSIKTGGTLPVFSSFDPAPPVPFHIAENPTCDYLETCGLSPLAFSVSIVAFADEAASIPLQPECPESRDFVMYARSLPSLAVPLSTDTYAFGHGFRVPFSLPLLENKEALCGTICDPLTGIFTFGWRRRFDTGLPPNEVGSGIWHAHGVVGEEVLPAEFAFSGEPDWSATKVISNVGGTSFCSPLLATKIRYTSKNDPLEHVYVVFSVST